MMVTKRCVPWKDMLSCRHVRTEFIMDDRSTHMGFMSTYNAQGRVGVFRWFWLGRRFESGFWRLVMRKMARRKRGRARMLERVKRILRTHGAWWDRVVRLFLTHGPLGDTCWALNVDNCNWKKDQTVVQSSLVICIFQSCRLDLWHYT